MSISLFLLWLVSIPLFTHADSDPDSRGFLINCGSKEAVEQNGLKYIEDEGFASAGELVQLNRTDVLPVLLNLRSFPYDSDGKNCYEFTVIKGSKFLIKTMYFYGGFDGGTEPPVFDQIIDGTRWSIVNTTEDYRRGLSSYYEIIVTAQSRMLSVCLARNEHTTSSPFISTLEVQYLDDSVYNGTDFRNYGLVTVVRNYFGSGGEIISFPDDPFNRYWQSFMDSNPTVQSHSNVTTSEFWNNPPAKAFHTGITTSRGKSLSLKWPPFHLPSNQYYVALYFQDNRTPSPFSWRVFNVAINGEIFYSNLNVTTKGVMVFGKEWPLSGAIDIELTPRNDMPVGPVINAGEVYQILPLGGTTLNRDVLAMQGLKRSFDNPPRDWNGDPCLPKQNRWPGVTCSEGASVRVVSLNLNNHSISGTLSKEIAKMTALTEINLADNQLTGAIPDLSPLKALEKLHLERNQFEGQIPESLGQLPKLREISLVENKFNGTRPNSLISRNDISMAL